MPEIKDLKINILGELDAIVSPNTIIATNSSSFTTSEIFDRVKHKDRLINTHYYMPPHSLPLEIMPSTHTHSDIAPLIFEQATKHGFHPYHVRKESVGLIANRIWAAIKRESLLVAAEGVAEPREIDSLLTKALGMKLGPFQAMDGVGLDVVRDIERHYQEVRDGLPKEVITLLDSYIEQGKLGTKAGEGFYKHPSTQSHEADHLVCLDLVRGEVRSMTTDGRESKQLVTGLSTMPDGVQFDPKEGYVYWTNMGNKPLENDGSLQRIKPAKEGDKAGVPETIVKVGQTHTPKQLHLNSVDRKLYWCDREGGRLQRSNLDGSGLETLYDSAPGQARPLADARDWCVGITVDNARGLIYWSQKGTSKGGAGRILRANLKIPKGSTAEKRTDIETLFDHLPEPIDLELDESSSTLYWTDRGDPPFGNTVNRFTVAEELDPSRKARGPSAETIISDHYHEAIGLSLDLKNKRIYISDLLGSIYQIDLDGKNKKILVSDQGNFSGIAFVPASQ